MAKSVSLRDLHGHVEGLNRLITDARLSEKATPDLNFDTVRHHCNSILRMLGDPSSGNDALTLVPPTVGTSAPAKDRDPKAATATQPPHAADARPKYDPSSIWKTGAKDEPLHAADARPTFDRYSIWTTR